MEYVTDKNGKVWIEITDWNTGDIIEVPTKNEVCSRCRGEGKHTNPSIDGHGITSEEMDELGPDFEEDYFSGVYDVTCEECKGAKVVKVPDMGVLNDETAEIVLESLDFEAREAESDKRTMFYENGGY